MEDIILLLYSQEAATTTDQNEVPLILSRLVKNHVRALFGFRAHFGRVCWLAKYCGPPLEFLRPWDTLSQRTAKTITKL